MPVFLYHELSAHTASVRTSVQGMINLQSPHNSEDSQQRPDDLAGSDDGNSTAASRKRKKTEIVDVESKLILCVNNWAFVDGLSKTPKFVSCQAKDVSVSLKLSSPLFKSETGDVGADWSGYDFDRHGAAMPYSAFLSLMRSGDFVNKYLRELKSKYENDVKASEPSSSEDALMRDQNDDDNDDDAASTATEGNQSTATSTKQSVSAVRQNRQTRKN